MNIEKKKKCIVRLHSQSNFYLHYKEKDTLVRNLTTDQNNVHNQHQKGKCHHL